MRPRIALLLTVCLLIGFISAPMIVAGSEDSNSMDRNTGLSLSSQATNDSALGAGDRLQGIVGIQNAEVQAEIETRRFGIDYNQADSNASKGQVVAQEVTNLESELADLNDRKEDLRRGLDNGTISRADYRVELAILNVKAKQLQHRANLTQGAATQLPATVLENQGVDTQAIQQIRTNAANLTGPEVADLARSIAGNNAGREMAASNRENVPTRQPANPQPNRSVSDQSANTKQNDQSQSGGNGQQGADNRSFQELMSGQLISIVDQGTHELLTQANRLLALATSPLIGSAKAQTDSMDRPLFEVLLDRDGTADVTLVLTFDLTSDSDQRAFETLQNDETAQEDVKNRFHNRMESVANQSERITDREMEVTDPNINLTRSADGETGVVMISLTWNGLAGVEEDHLILTEPFASGFTPDREFRVRITAPSGFQVTTVRPDPDSQSDSRVAWQAGTDLSGFVLAFSPENQTPLPDTVIEGYQSDDTVESPVGEGNTGMPGFGALIALFAIGFIGLLGMTRH